MSKEPGKKSVLVVDDEPNVREALKLILSRSYDVLTFPDGEAVLAHLAKFSAHITADDQGFPNLVLLDLMMPGRDGLEILQELRDKFEHLPVIILTASNGVKSAVQAMKIGAVD